MDELRHYGVLGMKWGVRKDRRKKDRIFKSRRKRDKEEEEVKKKQAREMSDEQLRSAINRIRLEQEYANLTKKSSSMSAGQRWALNILKRAGDKAVTMVVDAATTKAVKTMLPDLFAEKKDEKKKNNNYPPWSSNQ